MGRSTAGQIPELTREASSGSGQPRHSAPNVATRVRLSATVCPLVIQLACEPGRCSSPALSVSAERYPACPPRRPGTPPRPSDTTGYQLYV